MGSDIEGRGDERFSSQAEAVHPTAIPQCEYEDVWTQRH